MKKIILLLVICNYCTALTQISVGYINGSYSKYPTSAIDFENLDYIVLSFLHPEEDGSVTSESWFPNPGLVEAAHNNGIKIIAGVGGYGGSDGFSPMAADSISRENFIDNIVNYCLSNDLDGIDLDWEYPGSSDRNNFTLLVKELREAFDSNGISTISAAIPSTDWNDGYDIPQLKNYLDWFGVMTYDFYGPWENTSGHDSPLYSSRHQYSSAKRSMDYYIGKGMPKDKMCLGVHFVGYNLNSSGLFESNNSGSAISYTNANAKISQGWIYNWDEICKVPYLINSSGTNLITYSDTNAVKLKSEFVVQNSLKGLIIWKIGEDYNGNITPLLSTMGKYMKNYPVNSPKIPLTIFPSDNSTVDRSKVDFVWEFTDSTTSFNLQISSDINFTNLLINEADINFAKYEINDLENNAKYYWRVSSQNLNGTSLWSEIKSFTLNHNVTSINEALSVGKFELNVYPNPFNPETIISWQIPNRSNVILKIFNILGEEAAVLLNEEKSAGEYQIKFSPSKYKLGSGVYICVLQTNRGIKSTKFIFAK